MRSESTARAFLILSILISPLEGRAAAPSHTRARDGTNDDIVNHTTNFQFVIDRLTKDNVTFLTVPNKMHRPNISDDATKYEKSVNDEIKNLKLKKATKEELKEYHDQIDYNKLV